MNLFNTKVACMARKGGVPMSASYLGVTSVTSKIIWIAYYIVDRVSNELFLVFRMLLFEIEKVVEVSLEYLEEWGGREVMKDPRFELVVGDAYAWLLNCEDKFDCVIMDISDPIEAGPGIMLYTKELYEHVVTVLTPNGVFVTQAGNADAVPMPHANAGARDTTCFGPIRNTLNEVYSCVLPYSMSIPSFGCDWGYVMAFNNASGDAADEWKLMSSESIDKLIEEYISGGEASFKMYDGITHRRMFSLTKGKATR